jgi:hypothetical protein
MKEKFIKLSQRLLMVDDDGVFGSNSIRAAQNQFGHIKLRGTMTPERWIALTIQSFARNQKIAPNIVIDGWWGHNTEDAAYRILGEKFERPDESPSPNQLPGIRAVRCWTPSDAQMTKRYGEVGTNQITISLPFPMRLEWDLKTRTSKATCHKEFAKPLLAALEAVRDHYTLPRLQDLNIDRFGGILNVRKKRGGSTWSAHAWGTAIDLWPSANQLAWKKNQAAFAKPEYEGLRRAFANAGLMSLGVCYDFDWMHWQLNP